jgi:hypothetical protein
MVFRPFHLDDDAILDMGINAAVGTRVAYGTDRMPDLHLTLTLWVIGVILFGFAQQLP